MEWITIWPSCGIPQHDGNPDKNVYREEAAASVFL